MMPGNKSSMIKTPDNLSECDDNVSPPKKNANSKGKFTEVQKAKIRSMRALKKDDDKNNDGVKKAEDGSNKKVVENTTADFPNNLNFIEFDDP